MRSLHVFVCAGVLAMGMFGCKSNESVSTTTTTGATTSMGKTPGAAASAEQKTTTPPMVMNWYGGEAYMGAPALDVTAALIKAGGGAEHFSFSAALVSMLGEKTVNAEVAKLDKQYGADKVKGFISGMDYAVGDAIKRSPEQGIKLPAPANLTGAELAKALVKAGQTSDGTFWSGRMFDTAISHDLHDKVMADINQNVSPGADELTHRILNQAMYDVGQALGLKDVKLASLH